MLVLRLCDGIGLRGLGTDDNDIAGMAVGEDGLGYSGGTVGGERTDDGDDFSESEGTRAG